MNLIKIKMDTYLVVTIKSWNIKNFHKYTKEFPGQWYLISNKEDFILEKVDKINLKKIFFPHWSWIIPGNIHEKYECILFHMTDLPFGRGGSPLQNLIARGIYKTKISAIRVVKELDAGDIYLKKSLNIKYGTAEKIFKRASKLIYSMIKEIITKNPKLRTQKGKVIKFNRRMPEDGDLAPLNNIREVYDYIRMLDGEGYPRAFIKNKNIKYEFFKPELKNGEIQAKVIIKKENKND